MSEGSAKAPEKGTEKPRKFQAIKGTRDILPPETALWNRVEQTAHQVFATYGYGEIRLPILEQTELFRRSVGIDTDIVSKEMFTFPDVLREQLDLRIELLAGQARNLQNQLPSPTAIKPFVLSAAEFLDLAGAAFVDAQIPQTSGNKYSLDELHSRILYWRGRLEEKDFCPTQQEWILFPSDVVMLARRMEIGGLFSLRPEATASVCRAYIEHGMHTLPQPVKLYYLGPMFRRERPQKGRYRQFYQIGAEVLGGPDAPAIDAEVIEMVMTYFAKLGLDGAALYINSIGCKECRPKYVALLKKELEKVREKLGEDSQRRIETNPLRVLDSKLEDEQAVIEKLPRISEHLCEDCRKNYADVKRELGLRGVQYQENWRLVRGLDYYVRTTFEITAAGLGSQNAVCGGGRYDGLVELLGGPPTKGTGFAIGEDRVVLSLQESGKAKAGRGLDIFVAWMGEKAYAVAVRATQKLREAGFSVELPATEQKFGKALGQADKLGARFALILGEEEVNSRQWTVKRLSDGTQKKISESEALAFLKEG